MSWSGESDREEDARWFSHVLGWINKGLAESGAIPLNVRHLIKQNHDEALMAAGRTAESSLLSSANTGDGTMELLVGVQQATSTPATLIL